MYLNSLRNLQALSVLALSALMLLAHNPQSAAGGQFEIYVASSGNNTVYAFPAISAAARWGPGRFSEMDTAPPMRWPLLVAPSMWGTLTAGPAPSSARQPAPPEPERARPSPRRRARCMTWLSPIPTTCKWLATRPAFRSSTPEGRLWGRTQSTTNPRALTMCQAMAST